MRRSKLTVWLVLLLVMLIALPAAASNTENNVLVKPEGDESPAGTRQTCPANSVFGQTPVGPAGDWTFATSDTGPTDGPYLAYDNFSNVDFTNGIRFWGINAYNDGSWSTCSEEPMPFEIIFYTDAAGQPGTAVATYNVSLTPVHTGILYADFFELVEYETALSPGVAPPNGTGWVSIQASGDPTCWFLWANSEDGDLSAYQWDGLTLNPLLYDLAFCLLLDPTTCDWNPGDPYKMHYPQLPDEAGWDVNATQPLILADDFQCSETGWIKDIHFWGSWLDGVEGEIQYFVLSLHEDIPADQSPTGYSMPGATLWERDIAVFDAIPIDPPTMEGWYDPSTDQYFPDNHQAYFQYNVCLDEPDWFWQEAGTIYWLNISAVLTDPVGTQWGWKSTLDHWNDDATWAEWGDLTWEEMYEPGDAVFSLFWVELDPTGAVVPPTSGGIEPFQNGTDVNGWFFYPDVEPPFWNIWFYDHPFDPERIKTAHIEFDLFATGPDPYLVFVVNYTTDLFPPGNPEPPLPGSPPEWTGRDTLMIFQGEEGHFIFDWELLDYNPEWVSIDVFGWNYIIPEGSGFIEHRCRPSLDLSFVITTSEETPEGACCYDPSGGGVDAACVVTTQADCEGNLMGTYMGDGTTCAGTEACCLPDGTCLDADALCCINVFGGVPQGAGTACTAAEACCLQDGSCVMLDPLCCLDIGGTPQGPGTQCSATEACCFGDGSCAMLDPLCCDDAGGTPQGAGTTCSGTTEACCFADGSCLDADPLCCTAMGGTPQGAGTVCLGDNNGNLIDDACEEQTGACCLDDGSCVILTAADCATQLGTYKGDGTVCLGDINGNGVDDICEFWEPGDGHKMHFPQLPDEAGWDVNATYPVTLADDWMCSQTGWVSDLHFWGSWRHGLTGQILFFQFAIYADIPADQSPTGYSMPGPQLWMFETDRFGATPLDPPTLEGWYDPSIELELPDDHQAYFQYDVIFDTLQNAFWQEEGTIYWLSITAFLEDDQEYHWGWKSSVDHWNDDAVWGLAPVYDWIELYEPGTGSGFPYTPGDVDGDGDVDQDDVDMLSNYIYGMIPPTSWTPDGSFYPACDVTGDCVVTAPDLMALTQFVQTGSPTPSYCPTYPPGEPAISLDLSFVITGGQPCDCVPGEANNDGLRNITDAVYLITYIFGGGAAPTPYPICSGDANCDCITNITDAVYLIQWIFSGGASPCDCQDWLTACGPPLR